MISPKICIDPGHHHMAPGDACGNGIIEHVTTWDICKKVKNLMDPNGQGRVVMTRNTLWETPSLRERVKISNESNADVFLSVHVNWMPDVKARGIETFHYRNSKSGETMANAVQGSLIAQTGAKDRGVKPDDQSGPGLLVVLKETRCPAILTEVGFVNDMTEAAALRSEAYLARIAEGIFAGLVRGLKELGKMPTNIIPVR